MANLKHMNNDMAVSPIVATLVLIIVAVIGAVAVGSIMGTFSSDVSKKVTSNGAGDAADTIGEIIVAGSTTVLPASEELAKVYMDAHPGVKITVQGGGSGAGFSATKMGVVDVGAMSESAKANPTKYDATGMDLKEYQIGGSGIVVIQPAAAPIAVPVTLADLKAVYDTDPLTPLAAGTIPANTVVVYRSDASGTANEFGKFIGTNGQVTPVAGTTVATTVAGASGNQLVLAAVKGTANSIGFVDMGYAFDSAGAAVSGIDVIDLATYNPTTKANIKTSLQHFNKGTTVPADYPMIRGLYYISNGEPSAIAKNYINFAQSPGATASINLAGMFSNADLA